MAVNLILYKQDGTTINLYNKDIANLSSVTRAEQRQGLNADDIVNITVESATKINFNIGDRLNVFSRWYKINRLPTMYKAGNRLFTYNLELEGVQYDLARATYDLNIDTTNNDLQDVQADTLTGNLDRFATVLISNANRVFPNKWKLGVVPTGTEDKTLMFGEQDNCLSVLQILCTEYNIEFEITQNGDINTINFKKAGQVFPYTFEYGKGKGLYGLERLNVSTSNITTRLKVYGGTKNITSKYRANRLCLSGKTKGQSFIEKTDAVNRFGIWEATKFFDDIYPKRTGKVTSITSGNVLKFSDSTMNFDLNEKEDDGITTKYLLAGVSAKIHFNSGNLSGYEFELQSYDHSTKAFTIKPFKDERDDTFPSEKSKAFQFDVNDEYVILDIALPQTYIDDAESLLASEADTYYDQNSQPKVQYSLSVAEDFLQSLSGVGSTSNIFSVGDYIPIKDNDIEVDKSVRIQSFTRDLLSEYKYQLTISDTANTSITNKVISDLIDIDKIIKINDLKDPARARRDWRSAQELLGMIFDTEGDYYTEKIKPNSIETSMLSVGAKSTQFGLANTVIQANYNANPNSVNIKGGVLSHYAIEDNVRIWNLADSTVTLSSNSAAYYIYAKCQKIGNAGSIILTTSQIKVDQLEDSYHFMIGVVNSVDVGLNARSVALTYGFTTVNGRFIRTGRIQSNDGKTYFDLDLGEIGGKITFKSNGSDTDLSDWSDGITGDIQDAQSDASEANRKAQEAIDKGIDDMADINSKLALQQQQIDGQVSNWFYPYSPTLSNYPANTWTTNAEKDRHIGDTFTNTQNIPLLDAGKSWRFVKNGSVYEWTQISDSDALLALQKASEAQSTADGKSTTFLTQPSNYSVGDMWVLNADLTVNGTAYKQGDVLTATQDSTTFNEAHWLKRIRYTDDTAVDNLEIGSRNYLLDSNFNSGTRGEYIQVFGTSLTVNNGILKSTVTEGGRQAVRVERGVYLNDIGTFTFSIKIKGTTSARIFRFQNLEGIISSNKEYDITGEWQILHVTFINEVVGDKIIRVYFPFADLGDFVEIDWDMLVKGNKPALDWQPAPEDIQAEINQAKQEALTASNTVQTNVGSLNTYVDGAFKDGVISEAEAKAIEKYKNTINEAMAKAEASYLKVYANTYLEGTAKTSLANAKINLWGQRDTLLTTINNAIADGKTTIAEKNAVDSAFNTFNNLMSAFQSALEEANKAIQKKLDDISKGYVDNLEIGGRNLVPNSGNFNNTSGWLFYSATGVLSLEGNTIKASGASTGIPRLRPPLLLPLTETSQELRIAIEYIGDYNISTISGKSSSSTTSMNEVGGQSAGTFTLLKNEIIDGNRKKATFRWLTLAKTDIQLASWIMLHIGMGETINIVNINIAYGNKIGSWTPAPEDVQASIDKSQADANVAKAKTQFMTTINGGLIYTALMKLFDASGSGQESAGISGIMGALRNNPSFWSGGTYSQAMAVVNFLQKIKNNQTPSYGEYANLAKVMIAHDGASKIGHFLIEEGGRIIMVDPSTAKSRLIFQADNIPSIDDLNNSNSASDTVSILGTTVNFGGTTSSYLGGTLNVARDASTINTGSVSFGAQGIINNTDAAFMAELHLMRNGVEYTLLDFGHIMHGQDVYSHTVAPRVFNNMPRGDYRLRLKISAMGNTNQSSATAFAGSTQMSYSFQQAGVRYFQFGLNGMMAYFSANHIHFTENGGWDVRGKTNMPGVLAKGRIMSSGSRVTANAWGAHNSTSSISKPSGAGSYRVPVNCPNGNYDVDISPRTANRTFYVGTTTATYFEVYFRDQNGNAQDSEFSYTLVGDNY